MSRGKHRAGPDNARLRQENKLLEGRVAWYRRRLREVTGTCRTLRARAEIAEGLLEASEQLVARQVGQMQAKDARIQQLRQELEAATADTVKMPAVTQQELAGVAA